MAINNAVDAERLALLNRQTLAVAKDRNLTVSKFMRHFGTSDLTAVADQLGIPKYDQAREKLVWEIGGCAATFNSLEAMENAYPHRIQRGSLTSLLLNESDRKRVLAEEQAIRARMLAETDSDDDSEAVDTTGDRMGAL